VGVSVDCAGVADRKLAAIREHVTQAQDAQERMGDGSEQLEALGFEAHVIAWPGREEGPVLRDVFEGL
jgi:LmbE family N-acetylglucosaminyl deacetylase